MRTIAPAKINWTLEVLGRREDGYHEIQSVMQTIDLCDELSAERSEHPVFETVDGRRLAKDDLIVRAAKALERWVGRELPARIRVEKRIPVASGLGGGSSDAAAVLRLLNRLHELRLTEAELSEVGASVGSDVAFLVYGGTALAEGRGERITPLPDVRAASLVLVSPPIKVPNKTKRMYELLSEADFFAGSRGEALSERLQNGKSVRVEDLLNVFERVADTAFEGLDVYRKALLSAGAEGVHPSGAGPVLFALAESQAAARSLANRIQVRAAKVFVTRTLTAREATAVTD